MISSTIKPSYYCQHIEDTSNGERYRLGTENPKYYILKAKAQKDYNQTGILETHDIYREYPTRLFHIPDAQVAHWLNRYLTKARQAMRNNRYNQILAETGFFQSTDYKKWQKQNRYGH
ncbi:hypothetical protein [Acinetobacter stercoris]|uniref:Uncharacterized protein n=1 Tax=Acinetobacter stercoris TaxID=2126983 RepID=A0A2U3N393_9GAMM|nr:hypothetical protein [Acinetobacter stercoris]SPL72019.1 hypothetical protein KPC_3197 [Acinetobacter stercoris]